MIDAGGLCIASRAGNIQINAAGRGDARAQTLGEVQLEAIFYYGLTQVLAGIYLHEWAMLRNLYARSARLSISRGTSAGYDLVKK